MIPGWTKGLLGQKQGSTVQIDIPFEDAYGAAGRPPAIGPSDPLTFIVQHRRGLRRGPGTGRPHHHGARRAVIAQPDRRPR